jgi:DNA modification methylase
MAELIIEKSKIPPDLLGYFEPIGLDRGSVWRITKKPFKEAHFATFQEDLIRPCILAGSKTNDIVIDPFMGAGTTALVSKSLGRDYVGIELNAEYIKIAEKRLQQEYFRF